MSIPRIVVIGAATLDIKGKAKRALLPLTSNPGDIHFGPGGEARNVAENLARLGLETILLSAVGQDGIGATIIADTAAAGVDISRVIQSEAYRSPTYLAVLDDAGALAISIEDMEALTLIRPQFIFQHRSCFAGAAMVVIDANLSERAIQSVLRIAEHYRVPVAANTVSVGLASRLRPFLSRLSILTANAAEASALLEERISDTREAQAAAQRLVGMGVGTVIITLADMGLCYATSRESGHMPAIRCDVVDYTGAGAALMAAVIYGIVNAFPINEAMRLGVSAATLTLKCPETVSKEMSLDSLYDALVI